MKELEALKQFAKYVSAVNSGEFELLTEESKYPLMQTIEYEQIKQALNELDRLRVFKKTFDEYELAQKQGFIVYENWQECEKELETMKAKVKRYMELKPDVTGFHRTDNFEEKWQEFHDLESELMKVSEEK